VVGSEVPDPMVDMFVGDITDGIAGTSVKAGMLKCADRPPGADPGRRAGDAAVGKAQQQTGVPVTVHTHPGSQTAST
jgi:phosphotriesterase-related protein